MESFLAWVMCNVMSNLISPCFPYKDDIMNDFMESIQDLNFRLGIQNCDKVWILNLEFKSWIDFAKEFLFQR